MVVSFNLRFDEAFHIFDPPTAPGVTTTALSTGKVPTPVPSGKLTPQPLLTETGAQRTGVNSNTLINRIPKSANIELPGFRQAGHFSLTFDYRDLPIDPRLLRAISVEIFAGTVPASNFATGMTGFQSDGGRASVLQPSLDNLLLFGLVDEWNVTHGQTTSEIHLEGRDMRGLLLDTAVDPALERGLNLTKPIDDVVLQILAKNPLGKRFNVVTYAQDWLGPGAQGPLLLPAPATTTSQIRARRSANGVNPRSALQGNTDQRNYWTLITHYCQLVGALPTFVGPTLVIRPFRSLWDQQHGGLTPDLATPFAGQQDRNVTTGAAGQTTTNPIRVRSFVFGRDIQTMNIGRKYGGTGLPGAVLCLSVNPDAGRGNKKLVFGSYPGTLAEARAELGARGIDSFKFTREIEKALRSRVAPSGAAAAADILRVPVPGVKDASRLRDVARAIFEEVKRGEMGGSVQTKNLTSFGGSNADPDVLRLRPGDAVELKVDQRALSSSSPLVSVLNNLARMSISEATKELQARVGLGQPLSEDIARVIVATAQGSVVELQTFFRVSNVKYTWGAESGLAVAFDFQNYIEAANLTASPTTGAGRTKTTKAST
jgi:hypothetical protein